MDGLTIEHPLFQLLKKEHGEIFQKLQRLEQLKDDEILKEDLLWLWENAEIRHHQREEKILFNFLLGDKRTDGGGPLCMIFMDQYILQPPLERARLITGLLPELEEHQVQIFEQASAMRIPVNEHRACKEILRFMLANWETLTPVRLRSSLKEYSSLQLENIQKEETCFYFMCASLLRPEQADELVAKLEGIS